jgi:GNAT superfamily N-acetyltransferase
MRTSAIHLERIAGHLPEDLVVLRTEAIADGFGMICTLVQDWESGACRYDDDHEVLMSAWSESELAGIGGITRDPAIKGALRMRRFYVRRAFRRHGIGRQLAVAILDRVRPLNKAVFINAGTEMAPAFWVALGFIQHVEAGHTHILEITNLNQPD